MDSKKDFRNYENFMDKILKSFENTEEWPDLISVLGKIQKLILTYPHLQNIPKILVLSKRLAQCLHPALPSGVHVKALQIYEQVFKTIGQDRLIENYTFFTFGIFPLFCKTSLATKPIILHLYENYLILPLLQDKKTCFLINQCLSGILLGTFPGLEQGSDFIKKVTKLLDNIFDAFIKYDEAHEKCINFVCSLYSTMSLSTPSRAGVLAYLLDNRLKFRPILLTMYEDEKKSTQLIIIFQSFVDILNDDNILIKRNALDALRIYIDPLDCVKLQKKYHPRDSLHTSINTLIGILLDTFNQRNTTLQKRIISWFLPSETDTKQRSSIFPGSAYKTPTPLSMSTRADLALTPLPKINFASASHKKHRRMGSKDDSYYCMIKKSAAKNNYGLEPHHSLKPKFKHAASHSIFPDVRDTLAVNNLGRLPKKPEYSSGSIMTANPKQNSSNLNSVVNYPDTVDHMLISDRDSNINELTPGKESKQPLPNYQNYVNPNPYFKIGMEETLNTTESHDSLAFSTVLPINLSAKDDSIYSSKNEFSSHQNLSEEVVAFMLLYPCFTQAFELFLQETNTFSIRHYDAYLSNNNYDALNSLNTNPKLADIAPKLKNNPLHTLYILVQYCSVLPPVQMGIPQSQSLDTNYNNLNIINDISNRKTESTENSLASRENSTSSSEQLTTTTPNISQTPKSLLGSMLLKHLKLDIINYCINISNLTAIQSYGTDYLLVRHWTAIRKLFENPILRNAFYRAWIDDVLERFHTLFACSGEMCEDLEALTGEIIEIFYMLSKFLQSMFRALCNNPTFLQNEIDVKQSLIDKTVNFLNNLMLVIFIVTPNHMIDICNNASLLGALQEPLQIFAAKFAWIKYHLATCTWSEPMISFDQSFKLSKSLEWLKNWKLFQTNINTSSEETDKTIKDQAYCFLTNKFKINETKGVTFGLLTFLKKLHNDLAPVKASIDHKKENTFSHKPCHCFQDLCFLQDFDVTSIFHKPSVTKHWYCINAFDIIVDTLVFYQLNTFYEYLQSEKQHPFSNNLKESGDENVTLNKPGLDNKSPDAQMHHSMDYILFTMYNTATYTFLISFNTTKGDMVLSYITSQFGNISPQNQKFYTLNSDYRIEVAAFLTYLYSLICIKAKKDNNVTLLLPGTGKNEVWLTLIKDLWDNMDWSSQDNAWFSQVSNTFINIDCAVETMTAIQQLSHKQELTLFLLAFTQLQTLPCTYNLHLPIFDDIDTVSYLDTLIMHQLTVHNDETRNTCLQAVNRLTSLWSYIPIFLHLFPNTSHEMAELLLLKMILPQSTFLYLSLIHTLNNTDECFGQTSLQLCVIDLLTFLSDLGANLSIQNSHHRLSSLELTLQLLFNPIIAEIKSLKQFVVISRVQNDDNEVNCNLSYNPLDNSINICNNVKNNESSIDYNASTKFIFTHYLQKRALEFDHTVNDCKFSETTWYPLTLLHEYTPHKLNLSLNILASLFNFNLLSDKLKIFILQMPIIEIGLTESYHNLAKFYDVIFDTFGTLINALFLNTTTPNDLKENELKSKGSISISAENSLIMLNILSHFMDCYSSLNTSVKLKKLFQHCFDRYKVSSTLQNYVLLITRISCQSPYREDKNDSEQLQKPNPNTLSTLLLKDLILYNEAFTSCTSFIKQKLAIIHAILRMAVCCINWKFSTNTHDEFETNNEDNGHHHYFIAESILTHNVISNHTLSKHMYLPVILEIYLHLYNESNQDTLDIQESERLNWLHLLDIITNYLIVLYQNLCTEKEIQATNPNKINVQLNIKHFFTKFILTLFQIANVVTLKIIDGIMEAIQTANSFQHITEKNLKDLQTIFGLILRIIDSNSTFMNIQEDDVYKKWTTTILLQLLEQKGHHRSQSLFKNANIPLNFDEVVKHLDSISIKSSNAPLTYSTPSNDDIFNNLVLNPSLLAKCCWIYYNPLYLECLSFVYTQQRNQDVSWKWCINIILLQFFGLNDTINSFLYIIMPSMDKLENDSVELNKEPLLPLLEMVSAWWEKITLANDAFSNLDTFLLSLLFRIAHIYQTLLMTDPKNEKENEAYHHNLIDSNLESLLYKCIDQISSDSIASMDAIKDLPDYTTKLDTLLYGPLVKSITTVLIIYRLHVLMLQLLRDKPLAPTNMNQPKSGDVNFRLDGKDVTYPYEYDTLLLTITLDLIYKLCRYSFDTNDHAKSHSFLTLVQTCVLNQLLNDPVYLQCIELLKKLPVIILALRNFNVCLNAMRFRLQPPIYNNSLRNTLQEMCESIFFLASRSLTTSSWNIFKKVPQVVRNNYPIISISQRAPSPDIKHRMSPIIDHRRSKALLTPQIGTGSSGISPIKLKHKFYRFSPNHHNLHSPTRSNPSSPNPFHAQLTKFAFNNYSLSPRKRKKQSKKNESISTAPHLPSDYSLNLDDRQYLSGQNTPNNRPMSLTLPESNELNINVLPMSIDSKPESLAEEQNPNSNNTLFAEENPKNLVPNISKDIDDIPTTNINSGDVNIYQSTLDSDSYPVQLEGFSHQLKYHLFQTQHFDLNHIEKVCAAYISFDGKPPQNENGATYPIVGDSFKRLLIPKASVDLCSERWTILSENFRGILKTLSHVHSPHTHSKLFSANHNLKIVMDDDLLFRVILSPYAQEIIHVYALNALSKYMFSALNIIYQQSSKESHSYNGGRLYLYTLVTPIIFPYLRERSSFNAPAFEASCRILNGIFDPSSITSSHNKTSTFFNLDDGMLTHSPNKKPNVNITLNELSDNMTNQNNSLSPQISFARIIRKELWEIFCDSNFFRTSNVISLKSLGLALNFIIRSDATYFKDIISHLSSLNVNVTSSLFQLFSRTEQENFNRLSWLKRLTFIILTGKFNQYEKMLPDIQEKIVDYTNCITMSDGLVLPLFDLPIGMEALDTNEENASGFNVNVSSGSTFPISGPQRQMQLLKHDTLSQLLLCFSCLLLRLSDARLTSLWPAIMTLCFGIIDEWYVWVLAFKRMLSPSPLQNTTPIKSGLDDNVDGSYRTSNNSVAEKNLIWKLNEKQMQLAPLPPSAFKLCLMLCRFLDLALSLLPQQSSYFKTSAWCFVGNGEYEFTQGVANDNNMNGLTKLQRIAQFFVQYYDPLNIADKNIHSAIGHHPLTLLGITKISNFQPLLPLFHKILFYKTWHSTTTLSDVDTNNNYKDRQTDYLVETFCENYISN